MNNDTKLNAQLEKITHSSSKDSYIPDLDGSIWLASNNQNWGSHRRMMLLQAIDETGSISAGAKKVGISYKGAWDAIETMNNITQYTLVNRTLGGAGGGGAQLTPHAKQMVALYNSLNKAHTDFLKHLSLISNSDSPDLDLINNLVLSESIRNKITGTIKDIKTTDNSVEVSVAISDSASITANIKTKLWQDLKLSSNDNVLIFIDAANVLLAKTDLNAQLSARNQLTGIINNIEHIDGNANIKIALAPNVYITSLVTASSAKRLNLKVNCPILIVFKSSSVTLGKPLT